MNGPKQTAKVRPSAEPARTVGTLKPLLPFPVRESDRDWLRGLLQPALDALLLNVGSPETEKSYRCQASQFFAWHGREYPHQLPSMESVGKYRAWLKQRGLKLGSRNVALSVIRSIAQEAASPELRLLSSEQVTGILRVEREKQSGDSPGNWLNEGQAQTLLKCAGRDAHSRLAGLREAAIVAVTFGSGLRRAETAGLTLGQLHRSQEGWQLLAVLGKGNRRRPVEVAEWEYQALKAWMDAAGLDPAAQPASPVFRKLNWRGGLTSQPLKPDSIGRIVREAGDRSGQRIRTHDLRRSHADLAEQNGVPVRDIQLALGHRSLETTMRYLRQKPKFRPCDYLLRAGSDTPNVRGDTPVFQTGEGGSIPAPALPPRKPAGSVQPQTGKAKKTEGRK